MSFLELLGSYAAALLLAGVLYGQSTGTIRGVVRDPSGALVPAAKVLLTNVSTQRRSEGQSSETGTYSFTFLQPGDYVLGVEHSGFKRYEQQSITVDVTAVRVIDVTLEVGSSAESVDVTAEAEQLQTSTSDLGHVVDNTMMNAVPLSSWNFTQVLALSPGVTANVIDAGATDRNSVNISANGARPGTTTSFSMA